MVDPKLFESMKPEQAVRAAVALVLLHSMLSGKYSVTPTILTEAFTAADEFLKRALQP